MTNDPSYSIAVRVQRTTVEATHVRVPVTETLLKPSPDGDGFQIDTDALFAAAVQLGEVQEQWTPEERQVSVHPMQTPPPWAPEATTQT